METKQRLEQAGITEDMVAKVMANEVIVRQVAADPGKPMQAEAVFAARGEVPAMKHILTDYPNYTTMFPEVKYCETVERGDSHFVVKFKIKALPVLPTYNYLIRTEVNEFSLNWELLKGDFKKQNGEYVFYPLPDGNTIITYKNQIQLKGILSIIPDWVLDRILSFSLPELCHHTRDLLEK